MDKKIAIMQPYFFPYMGYWQLMSEVDQFVIYDNIEFTKKGWINRNRFLKNGQPDSFTLPIRKDSDHLDLSERYLADSFNKDSQKLLRKIEGAYRKSPNFDEGIELIEKCFLFEDINLFNFVHHSIRVVKAYLEIDTEIIVSSNILCDHSLRGEQRVKAICHALDATSYINPIGGSTLYSKKDFRDDGIELAFHSSMPVEYMQFSNAFIPTLSILDVIMFNQKNDTRAFLLNDYNIV